MREGEKNGPSPAWTATSTGGANARASRRIQLVALIPPSVTAPQSLRQDRPAATGPLRESRLWLLRQQHFDLTRLQEALVEDESDWAASGAREESEKSRTRLTATRPRAHWLLRFASCIPLSRSIACGRVVSRMMAGVGCAT